MFTGYLPVICSQGSIHRFSQCEKYALPTDGQMDGQINKQTDRRMEQPTDRPTNGPTNQLTNIKIIELLVPKESKFPSVKKCIIIIFIQILIYTTAILPLPSHMQLMPSCIQPCFRYNQCLLKEISSNLQKKKKIRKNWFQDFFRSSEVTNIGFDP